MDLITHRAALVRTDHCWATHCTHTHHLRWCTRCSYPLVVGSPPPPTDTTDRPKPRSVVSSRPHTSSADPTYRQLTEDRGHPYTSPDVVCPLAPDVTCGRPLRSTIPPAIATGWSTGHPGGHHHTRTRLVRIREDIHTSSRTLKVRPSTTPVKEVQVTLSQT
jgi:hypothetical protein